MVYICSPLRGNVTKNIERAIEYCRFAASKGVIPFAPHVYFTQFLDDTDPVQRAAGMRMGLAMLPRCKELWVFGPPSEGMRAEIELAQKLKKKIVTVRE